MSQDSSLATLYPDIPNSSMLPIEAAFLKGVFSSEPGDEDDSTYFFSEESFSDMFDLDLVLVLAFVDGITSAEGDRDLFEQSMLDFVAELSAEDIGAAKMAAAAGEPYPVEFSDANELWGCILQRIIKRDPNISAFEISGANTSSRFSPGSQSGFAIFITADEVKSFDTSAFLEEQRQALAVTV